MYSPDKFARSGKRLPETRVDWTEHMAESDLVHATAALDLMDQLLQVDPKKRLTAAQALKHPFLRKAPPKTSGVVTKASRKAAAKAAEAKAKAKAKTKGSTERKSSSKGRRDSESGAAAIVAEVPDGATAAGAAAAVASTKPRVKTSAKTSAKSSAKSSAKARARGSDSDSSSYGARKAPSKSPKQPAPLTPQQERMAASRALHASLTNASLVLSPIVSRLAAPVIKIVSWNVCSLKACRRDGRFEDYVTREAPDILCLQETKLSDATLPAHDDLSTGLFAGFHVTHSVASEPKGHHGTAVYSRWAPLSVTTLLGDPIADVEGRLICYEFADFFLVNTYVPNSGMALKRLSYRTGPGGWDERLRAFLQSRRSAKAVVWTGDLNVAPAAIDVDNPKTKVKLAGFTPEERASFETTLALGWEDCWRALHGAAVGYSFFSMRVANGRERNMGWRLDHFVASDLARVGACEIRDRAVVGSDHLPVVLLWASQLAGAM
eukprot:c17236_g1_i3.p1 GENE.c17236_g1_i3~~c17236_g1_i3.p1  ORF type:complete len:500 (-),score=87.38 c17236_g1_i3:14-1492(-)